MSKKRAKQSSWHEGAQREFLEVYALYAAIIDATENADKPRTKQLRRRLFRTIRRAMKKARYKGRLLGVLGNATLRNKKRLAILLTSYDVSKKEGDSFNCLLASCSLAEFFVRDSRDVKKAHYWIARARPLLKRFKRSGMTHDVRLLSQEIGESSAL